VPIREQQKMVNRACKIAIEWHENEINRYRKMIKILSNIIIADELNEGEE
jgi:hypothetical protein